MERAVADYFLISPTKRSGVSWLAACIISLPQAVTQSIIANVYKKRELIVHPSLPIPLTTFSRNLYPLSSAFVFIIIKVILATSILLLLSLKSILYITFEMTKQLAPGARLEGKVAIVTG